MRNGKNPISELCDLYYKEQFQDTANFTSNHFKAIHSAHSMLLIDPPRVNVHSHNYATIPLLLKLCF